MRNWKTKRLDDLGSVGRGRSRHRPRNDPALYGGAYPFFQTGDITAAEFYLRDHSQTYNEIGLAQSKLWQPGTLCITIAANIAETAILDVAGCFPDSVVGFISDPSQSDVRFVKYLLDFTKIQMQVISKGTTQDNLSLEKLLSISFRVPEAGEQKRIAELLVAFDDLIDVNARRIAVTEEMARRIFDERFGTSGHKGHSRNNLMPKRLGDLADDIREAVDPRSVAPETPYVGLEHIPRRSTTMLDWGRADEVGSLKLRFRKGDILFGKIRPYFHKAAVAPVAGVSSSDAIVIRPRDEMYRAIVALLTSSDSFVAHAVQTSNGTKMPRADWRVLRDFPVVLPPRDEVVTFDETVWPMVELAANLAAQNRNLRAQRDILLPKLISGEIDVSRAERLEAAE